MQGGTLCDRIRKFSKKKSQSAEKKPNKKTKRKKTFGLASTFGSIKKLWFIARIEPTISCFSENQLNKCEQMNKDCKKSGPLRVRLSTEKKKQKKTTHCKSRAFFLWGKGAD